MALPLGFILIGHESPYAREVLILGTDFYNIMNGHWWCLPFLPNAKRLIFRHTIGESFSRFIAHLVIPYDYYTHRPFLSFDTVLLMPRL